MKEYNRNNTIEISQSKLHSIHAAKLHNRGYLIEDYIKEINQ